MPSFGEQLMDVDINWILRMLRHKGVLPKSLGCKLLEQIPAVPLSQVVRKPTIKVVGTYSYVDGYLPWCDILALISVLVDRSPHTILEVGTFNGYTTRLMALNVPDAEIHTIDLPEDFADTGDGPPKDDFHLIAARRVGSEYRADPSIKSIQQHFGDSAEITFPVAEFCFIDGSHTYAYARNDTEKALASGAAKTLLWHDCDQFHPGVTAWLVEMIQAGHSVRRIEGTNLAMLDTGTQSLHH